VRDRRENFPEAPIHQERILVMYLSRFRAAPSAGLGQFSFECDRAFAAQCRLASAWILEAVDVFADDQFCGPACRPRSSPDQLCPYYFEEGLDDGVDVTVTFAAHRYLEPALA
jgi:hypothetical protein